MVSTKFAPLVLGAALFGLDVSAARVDPAVHRTLRQQGTANLLVTMKKGTQDLLNSIKEASFTSRGALIDDMVNRLQDHAAESQSEVSSLFVKEAAGEYTKSTSFWITNQVYIEGATMSFLQRLAAMPTVAQISEEDIYTIPDVPSTPINAIRSLASAADASTEWGLDKIQAPAVWAAGNTGDGVIVGGLDTGVLATHEALKNNFRDEYGWYDAVGKLPEPYDNNGHGTHTMATVAGSGGVGVAPGVTWMACKGCREDRSCLSSQLLACFQFTTCPTDPKGENRDCSKAPHIVNNSWSNKRNSSAHQAVVDTWRTAGIIPVFSVGNNGRTGCETSNSPAEYLNVIAVGATDAADALAEFSSKGPTAAGRVKPEIAAPGHNVRSAWFTDDSEYKYMSGTSMATPHVSGAIALMLAAKPGLKFDEVRDLLINNVDTAHLPPSNFSCGNTVDGVFPNNMYGYGRLNVFKAIQSLNQNVTESPVEG